MSIPEDHPERQARRERYHQKFGDRFPVKYFETKEFRKGSAFQSAQGRKATVVDMDRKTITVDVERAVTRNGHPVVEKRRRVVPRDQFAAFARGYRKA